jgi:dTDP-4-dehydrorhamnose 3,5-epimerase
LRFVACPLAGAFEVEAEPIADERGFFARTFCAETFVTHGLEPTAAQCSVSWNRARGTLRGMHWQTAPHGEAKLVRCTRGAIHDVIVDLRRDSPTFLRAHGVLLDAASRRALYVPRGFAHGFITLEDDTEVLYQMSAVQVPQAARGARWNDPAFGIRWPLTPAVMSARDRDYPDFVAAAHAEPGGDR